LTPPDFENHTGIKNINPVVNALTVYVLIKLNIIIYRADSKFFIAEFGKN